MFGGSVSFEIIGGRWCALSMFRVRVHQCSTEKVLSISSGRQPTIVDGCTFTDSDAGTANLTALSFGQDYDAQVRITNSDLHGATLDAGRRIQTCESAPDICAATSGTCANAAVGVSCYGSPGGLASAHPQLASRLCRPRAAVHRCLSFRSPMRELAHAHRRRRRQEHMDPVPSMTTDGALPCPSSAWAPAASAYASGARVSPLSTAPRAARPGLSSTAAPRTRPSADDPHERPVPHLRPGRQQGPLLLRLRSERRPRQLLRRRRRRAAPPCAPACWPAALRLAPHARPSSS